MTIIISVHEHLISTLAAASETDSSNTATVLTAVIAAIGTVLTALITAWLARWKARRATPAEPVIDITARYIGELRSRAQRAEARAEKAEDRMDTLELENALLRERHRLDRADHGLPADGPDGRPD